MIKWIRRWWPFVGLVFLTVVGFAWMSRRPSNNFTPLPDLRLEFRALTAEGETAKAIAGVEAQAALAKVREEHKATLEALNAEQSVEATRLAGDPEALAGFLIRAAG